MVLTEQRIKQDKQLKMQNTEKSTLKYKHIAQSGI